MKKHTEVKIKQNWREIQNMVYLGSNTELVKEAAIKILKIKIYSLL